MADVLKYAREDLKSLVYHPIRPLDVVSEEIGIPVDQVLSVSLFNPSHGPMRRTQVRDRGFWMRGVTRG